jgi:hypothetical protein
LKVLAKGEEAAGPLISNGLVARNHPPEGGGEISGIKPSANYHGMPPRGPAYHLTIRSLFYSPFYRLSPFIHSEKKGLRGGGGRIRDYLPEKVLLSDTVMMFMMNLAI